ncbi:MAG: DUF2203 domain-containing protein [Deltaproteobacteria bacterium]|nr:DUF2203 domain-containing protein [Deltaproteobacteria bacterium]
MNNVVELKKNKKFTLKEAEAVLPIIRKITRETIRQVQDFEWRTNFGNFAKDQQHLSQEESQLQMIIERWTDKVSKLGAEPKGFWLVDFDSGEGYFCWKYPEEQLNYFHEYKGGFTGRTPIV